MSVRRLNWTPWSKKNKVDFEDAHKNKGPGERKVAWELAVNSDDPDVDYIVVEDNHSPYDIVGTDGSRWEVKGKRSCIIPGRTAKRATDLFMIDVKYAAKQIYEAVCWPHSSDELRSALAHVGVDVELLQQFVTEHFDLLSRGELCRARVDAFAKVLWNVHHARDFKFLFKHKYFSNPGKFRRDYANHAVPSKMFANINGLIIADKERGYVVIKPRQLDSHLIFDGISRDYPQFRVVGVGEKG